MAEPTWPSISSALDETIAQLDRLHQTEASQQASHLADLRAAVAALDFGPPAEVEPAAEGHERTERPSIPSRPYVALPQRTTRGGDWGPVVREKLREEALRKRASRW